MASPVDRYIAALFAQAPASSFVELRYRAGQGMRQTFYPIYDLAAAATAVGRLALRCDVYIGVLPRRRCGGGREDLVDRGSVLWVDCDGPRSVEALRAFALRPSVIVSSGTDANRHAYWLLSCPAPIDDIERANHQLAGVLGADVSCADRARILRPPSLNHKTEPPTSVRLVACAPRRRYKLEDIVRELPPPRSPARMSRSDESRAIIDDPLLAVPPATYVEQLTGLRVPRSAKVACPFHQDGTPSLHVYPEPERGWYCYGCRRGGSVYDFASLLLGISTRGSEFVELRERLIVALKVGDVTAP